MQLGDCSVVVWLLLEATYTVNTRILEPESGTGGVRCVLVQNAGNYSFLIRLSLHRSIELGKRFDSRGSISKVSILAFLRNDIPNQQEQSLQKMLKFLIICMSRAKKKSIYRRILETMELRAIMKTER